MMRRTLLGLLLMAGLVAPALSEELGYALELSAEKDLSKQLDANLNTEIRSMDGLSAIERWSIGAGLDYRLAKWKKADASLKTDLGYLLMGRHYPSSNTAKYHYPAYWTPRHRAFAGLTALWSPAKHWQISLRERYQMTHYTAANLERYYLAQPDHRASDKVKEAHAEHMLRSRVQVKWGRKKCSWEPFASVEIFNDLQSGMQLDQTRFTLGTHYKLNKQNDLSVAYRFKDKSDEDEAKGHLITFSYAFTF